MRQAIIDGLPALGLHLTEEQIDRFCAFGQALLEKNQVMNLTAITEPQAVARLHFLDSLTLLGCTELAEKSVVDVGCGAGFPGVPLKIAEPTLELTLLDSLTKRVNWLSETLPAIGVEAECVSARAEEFAQDHREQYDAAVSRAVARLSSLAELCLPLVRVGGVFLAMKSAGSDQELSEAARGIHLLGGVVESISEFPIPGTDAVHRVVVIRKERPRPKQYPRRYAKIKQSPLE